MAVIEGATTAALAEVDATTKGLRVVNQPKDVSGAYSAGGVTGILPAALASGSSIFAIRNGPTSNTKRGYITRLYLKACIRSVASVFTDWSLEVVRFSVANTSGGTALTCVNKKQAGGTAASACTVGGGEGGDIRIATTSALTVTGITFDTPVFTILYVPIISATVPAIGAQFERVLENDSALEHPIELGPGEGLAVRTVGATPTGITANVQVSLSWSER